LRKGKEQRPGKRGQNTWDSGAKRGTRKRGWSKERKVETGIKIWGRERTFSLQKKKGRRLGKKVGQPL